MTNDPAVSAITPDPREKPVEQDLRWWAEMMGAPSSPWRNGTQALLIRAADEIDTLRAALLSSDRAVQPKGENPRCAGCGGPHPFDTSLPSVVWNRVIRAQGLADYLCLSCIVEAFGFAKESFTATLWGKCFDGQPIAVTIDGTIAMDANLLSNENTELRARIRELEASDSAVKEPDMANALARIALGDDACRCDHGDENCCEVVGEFCPRCIAETVLRKAAKEEHEE